MYRDPEDAKRYQKEYRAKNKERIKKKYHETEEYKLKRKNYKKRRKMKLNSLALMGIGWAIGKLEKEKLEHRDVVRRYRERKKLITLKEFK